MRQRSLKIWISPQTLKGSTDRFLIFSTSFCTKNIRSCKARYVEKYSMSAHFETLRGSEYGFLKL